MKKPHPDKIYESVYASCIREGFSRKQARDMAHRMWVSHERGYGYWEPSESDPVETGDWDWSDAAVWYHSRVDYYWDIPGVDYVKATLKARDDFYQKYGTPWGRW